MGGLAIDDISHPSQFGIGHSDLVHDVNGVANRSQRISELMAQHGQKFVLTAIGIAKTILYPFAFLNFQFKLVVKPRQLSDCATRAPGSRSIAGFSLRPLYDPVSPSPISGSVSSSSLGLGIAAPADQWPQREGRNDRNQGGKQLDEARTS